jgi:hypothetical protein
MFPREDFFGFILIKTWMFNIITNFGAGSWRLLTWWSKKKVRK